MALRIYHGNAIPVFFDCNAMYNSKCEHRRITSKTMRMVKKTVFQTPVYDSIRDFPTLSPSFTSMDYSRSRNFRLNASSNDKPQSGSAEPATSSSTDSVSNPSSPLPLEVEEISTSSASENSAGQDQGNIVLALFSAFAAVGLFIITRLSGSGIDLASLSASSTPYDIALSNGKPTVIEFYADWCEVCKEMAKDVYSIEDKYKNDVNFVLLNIDNVKWSEELKEFGVDGIPQFTFLDSKGNEEGSVVGKIPAKFLFENVDALAQGKLSIPHANEVGEFSSAGDRRSSKQVEPRSHGI